MMALAADVVRIRARLQPCRNRLPVNDVIPNARVCTSGRRDLARSVKKIGLPTLVRALCEQGGRFWVVQRRGP
jgi:hypothetical protein